MVAGRVLVGEDDFFDAAEFLDCDGLSDSKKVGKNEKKATAAADDEDTDDDPGRREG